MSTKAILLISLILNAGLLGSIAFLTRQLQKQSYPAYAPLSGLDRVIVGPAQGGRGTRFGPEFEILLRLTEPGRPSELLDLETGNRLVEPSFEAFGLNPRACAAWLRSNGLDVSGTAIPGEMACCISYYMALVPVPAKSWERIQAEEVLSSPELAAIKDPKRYVFQADYETQTFLFKTAEGTTGILRIDGMDPEDRQVAIQYKLVVPGERAIARDRADASG